MIADDLSRIAMSSSLSDASARAVDYARAQGHIEVSLEHMLLALCEDPDAALVLASSNVDVARLVTDVSAYLGRIDDRALAESAADPVVSADLRRIFEAAAAAARGGRRREINGAIVLAAIVGDGKSAAAHILRAQGLTFDGAIRALQRPAAAKPHNADDILANARERVQSRSVPGLGSRRGEAPSAPAAEPAPPPPASYEPPAPAEEEFSPSPARPDVAFDEPAATPEEESNSPSTPAYAPEPQPEFEPAPEAERRQEPEGSYARSKPSSAPFPPPIPVPEVPASWVPPPPPPAPASNAPPPMSRMPPPPPPMPAAPVVRPGPPPLAPWPEMDNSPGPQRGRAGGPPPASYDSAARRAPADRSPPHPMAQPARSAAARPGQAMRAEIGQLVENIPRTMRVAVPALVEVRIARADVKALAEGLQGGGAAYRHEVTVTKAMSVRLRAPDGGFFIETASPETQWIEKTLLLSSDDFASWRWNVTPRGRGRKRLQLIISARTVSADGLAAETALPDQVVTVRVRINYGRAVSRWFGWAVAAVIGGVLARFADVAYDTGVQVVAKLMSG